MHKTIYHILVLGLVSIGLTNCSYLAKYESDALKERLSGKIGCPVNKINLGTIEYGKSMATTMSVSCGKKKFYCSQEKVLERNWHGTVTMGVYEDGRLDCAPISSD